MSLGSSTVFLVVVDSLGSTKRAKISNIHDCELKVMRGLIHGYVKDGWASSEILLKGFFKERLSFSFFFFKCTRNQLLLF